MPFESRAHVGPVAMDAEAGKEKRVRAKNEAWAYGEPEMAVWLTASPRKGW